MTRIPLTPILRIKTSHITLPPQLLRNHRGANGTRRRSHQFCHKENLEFLKHSDQSTWKMDFNGLNPAGEELVAITQEKDGNVLNEGGGRRDGEEGKE